MKTPNELFLEYIQSNYNEQLQYENKGQCKINIDYTLLNDYFQTVTHHDFFQYSNWKNIIEYAELEINEHNTSKNWVNLKIVDVPPNTELHNLDASYNGEIVSAKALIKNITETSPSMKKAVWECRGCMRLHEVTVHDNEAVVMPSLCSECGGRSFRPVYDLSEFRNHRYVKLEEPLELRNGSNSREFKGYMQDYLASPYHNLKAGDMVDIVGTFNIHKSNKNRKDSDFEFIIDLHNITPVDNAFEDYRLTEADKKEILELSQQPNIYQKLVDSLAPEIVGYDFVKQGLLLQLFEGYRPADNVYKSDIMDRWTIHILLIGDPGIGKSQIISALKRKAPKIIDIDGSDTSKAGLITSAVKDELTGSWTLEAGAVVMSDTGLLCIDEFDKLSKGSQKSLNQPMEQLTVSPAKAGIVQSMTARTSILACANPKYSKFNLYKSTIREQIDIPESTLSRFDLVFALTDTVNEDDDRELAGSLLNKSKLVNNKDLIDEDLFKKYITFAKLEVFPVLDDEAKQELIEFYVMTRQSAVQSNDGKPITARDLKALERLTIARAKTELRETATINDAKCAIQIYTEALKTIGLTPSTAGELSNVLSDVEVGVIDDAERMIKARMKQYNVKSVEDIRLEEVKNEIGLTCYSLGLNNRDEIIKTALENVKKSLGG